MTRVAMTVFRLSLPLSMLCVTMSLHAATTSPNYGKLPMSFEANRGQSDQRVKFIARGAGYHLFLTPTEAVLGLSSKSPAMVWMRLRGSNPRAQLSGVDLQQKTSNYFIGNNPARWQRNVPNYQGVKYAAVYPGIDLFFYGNQRQLEYDFVVAPGASPDRIELAFDGVQKVWLDSSGNLMLDTGNGVVIQHAPVIYQEMHGRRTPVDGRYKLVAERRVRFQVAAYDRTQPLRIDPVLGYSSYLGGSLNDIGRGIAVDNAGSAYITGETTSVNFPGTAPIIANGSYDVFVTKLNAAGNSILYSTYIGGSNADFGYAIAVDAQGSAYVTGQTNSPFVPADRAFPTVTPFQSTYNGGGDAFITKLTPAGDGLMYSSYYGGTGTERGEGIAVEPNGGFVYTTGTTNSVVTGCITKCFPTVAAYQGENAGQTDVYVAALNGTGGLYYSTFLGGPNSEYSGSYHGGIVVDGLGEVYITGTAGPGFPGTALSPIQSTFGGGTRDAFVAKLGQTGQLYFATYLGGADSDNGAGIALDSNEDVYVTGTTSSINFPTVAPFQATRGGVQTTSAQDGFVAKINHIGQTLMYSTYLGGSGGDNAYEIAVDPSGNAYVVGWTTSSDFPPASPIQPVYGGSGGDAFVTKFNSTGSALVYSSFLGGTTGADFGYSIALDQAGYAYVTGETNSTNFPIVGGVQTTYGGGGTDAFVTKIVSSAPLAPGISAYAVGTNTVNVQFAFVFGVTEYRVERKAAGGVFTQIGVTSSTVLQDTTASSNTAYLYRARAFNEAGGSPYSNVDLATTVIFTNPLAAAGMVVKAVDLSELRTAVGAVVSLSGSTATFTGPATPGTTIAALNVSELRSLLGTARLALGLPANGYSATAASGGLIRAVHFRELRFGVQ